MSERHLFGTDGIRGVAGKYPLDAATVRIIGAAAATVLAKKGAHPVVVMGGDTRESCSMLAAALKKGFSSCGVEVWDLGVVPTPGVSRIARTYPAIAGVVISASHNPYHDNGIKFFSHTGMKLSDGIEARIEAVMRTIAEQGMALSRKKAPARPKTALVKEYIDFLVNSFPRGCTLKGMKLVIDCAHGATYRVAAEVFKRLGATVIALNVAPNGKNINKNCGALHPEIVAAAVKKHKADCGLAFDGDGDRIIFADETGTVRDGDYLLALSAKFLKEQGKLPGNILVTTVMANLGLFKAMQREGVKVHQTKVGDRYVFEEMKKSGGVIGGEQSGHIIFRKIHPTGDGILSSLQVLGIMARTGKTLSELSAVMQKYPQVLINMPVARKVPLEHLPRTSKAVAAAEKALKGDGRILVRYSGTENLLRVMIEGRDKAAITATARELAELGKNEIERTGATK